MAKRKRVSLDSSHLGGLSRRSSLKSSAAAPVVPAPVPPRRASSRRASTRVAETAGAVDAKPATNAAVADGPAARRSSPDAETWELEAPAPAVPVKTEATTTTSRVPLADDGTGAERGDPEAEGVEDTAPEELQEAWSRPPAVNSSYLPLPWKGRLGYACLNTYLRTATPPVFSSRTCRIASILEHRHPLRDPSQPEHATKNRPDKTQPADVRRGQAYVEALGLANARDVVKMLRWNERYGIKFLRLSSEMFPFASHEVYGYALAPFAAAVLADAGRVAAELGHRLTTHPGQFTQLGSPRPEVIAASIRDLAYHCELLDLLRLPPQQNRDAIMVLHMGGVFGDKAATIARFRANYARLSPGIQARLVLENDDVSYSVHDLIPVCEELNIPLVLDYHHHNIVFDAAQVREGTRDVMDLYDRIAATWHRKAITQKMHYSEPTPAAVTARQRRKHSPRVATLPPCAPDMDLMIEAKDKEQAVLELMRTFKLPGHDTFATVIPHVRRDENRPCKAPTKSQSTPTKMKQKKVAAAADPDGDPDGPDAKAASTSRPPRIPDGEVSMGGPEGRVYWPPGMEEWLRPKKREVKERDPAGIKTTAARAALKRAEKAAWQAAQEAAHPEDTTTAVAMAARTTADARGVAGRPDPGAAGVKGTQRRPVRAPSSRAKGRQAARKAVLTPSSSDQDSGLAVDPHGDGDGDGDDDFDDTMGSLSDSSAVEAAASVVQRRPPTRTPSGRAAKKRVKYAESDMEVD